MTVCFQKNFLSVTLKKIAEDDDLSQLNGRRIDEKQNNEEKKPRFRGAFWFYSTVTDFARLRGWSTSVPLISAT